MNSSFLINEQKRSNLTSCSDGLLELISHLVIFRIFHTLGIKHDVAALRECLLHIFVHDRQSRGLRRFQLEGDSIHKSIRRFSVGPIASRDELDNVSRLRKRLGCLELMGPHVDTGRDDYPASVRLSLYVMSTLGHRPIVAGESNSFAERSWSNLRIFRSKFGHRAEWNRNEIRKTAQGSM